MILINKLQVFHFALNLLIQHSCLGNVPSQDSATADLDLDMDLDMDMDSSSVSPTYEAVVGPHALAVVAGAALHDVVAVVGLGHLVVGVDHHLGRGEGGAGRQPMTTREGRLGSKVNGGTDLEDVVAGLEVGDVDPLAVDVVSVGVGAAHRDPLGAEVRTGVSLLDAWWAEI